MKLLCDISIGNRLAPKLKRKSAKSTLALCKESKSKDFCIILFTGQNKNGTKYHLKDNIQQIFSRCVNEGKSTIQFKLPPHDIYINADTIQLKSFLHLLKLVLENKVSDQNLGGYSSMSVTPVAKKYIPQKKMYIRSRADYSTKGFAKSLEELHINNIKRCSVDKGILQLKCLKILDLSINLIESIPEELNQLPHLEVLNLSENLLGKCSPKQWSWMGGCLSASLKVLNISNNLLHFLPNQIAKLQNLRSLHVDNNNLHSFPTGIGKLHNLKVLSASNNSLSTLPGSTKLWNLQRLDLSYNLFYQRKSEYYNKSLIVAQYPPPCSLKESAARKVLRSKIPYTPHDLPHTIINYLDNAQYCDCGEACFENILKHSQTFPLNRIAEHFVIGASETLDILMDCHFCSLKCFILSTIYKRITVGSH